MRKCDSAHLIYIDLGLKLVTVCRQLVSNSAQIMSNERTSSCHCPDKSCSQSKIWLGSCRIVGLISHTDLALRAVGSLGPEGLIFHPKTWFGVENQCLCACAQDWWFSPQSCSGLSKLGVWQHWPCLIMNRFQQPTRSAFAKAHLWHKYIAGSTECLAIYLCYLAWIYHREFSVLSVIYLCYGYLTQRRVRP